MLKNSIVKNIILGVMAIMILGLFAGCGNKLPYNAVLHSNAKEWINAEFLKKNVTRGSQYMDEGGGVAYADWDESYPKTNTFIIQCHEDFEKIFTGFPPEVDFAKEILVLYMFTDITGTQPYNIESLKLDGTVLKIAYKLQQHSGNGDSASAPLQRCLVVKMDKLEITSAEFIKK